MTAKTFQAWKIKVLDGAVRTSDHIEFDTLFASRKRALEAAKSVFNTAEVQREPDRLGNPVCKLDSFEVVPFTTGVERVVRWKVFEPEEKTVTKVFDGEEWTKTETVLHRIGDTQTTEMITTEPVTVRIDGDLREPVK